MLLEWGYVGPVLAQQVEDGTLHSMAYTSRTLQPHERNYGATELEPLEWYCEQSILNTICMDMPIQN